MRDVVRQLIQALEQDRPLILCQVVETRGSTPQKAGAMMVVDPDGGQIGTLGGGCVENEVKQKALRQLDGTSAAAALVRPRPRLRLGRRPDLRRQDGDRLAAGARAGAAGLLPRPRQRLEQGDGFTEAVVVNPEPTAGGRAGRPLPVRRRRVDRSRSWTAVAVPDGLPSSRDPAARRPAQAEGRAAASRSCRACRGSGW